MEGMELKILRIKAGLTQIELAHKMDVKENRISKLETGRLKFHPADEKKIRKIFKLSSK